ncbi:O-antigen polysaccharide polymerase Wzy [Pseudoalteromonas sp. NSLLW24]|uniref:O-antigen polysaccharide polymerase Wzy n=1 Tax=Pseudoalteromonas sp. NSLLW24 TaxID=2792050 RepID=UPI0018CEEC6F|nr:O-antigen polysaccharide polymerase Wzy [Pseudoalteromonas sp. NSLLW24]MBG9999212.1 O-antigen polysaccharide polymerase Wzy [Pseudoalteromonas sp. NSLLW24]
MYIKLLLVLVLNISHLIFQSVFEMSDERSLWISSVLVTFNYFLMLYISLSRVNYNYLHPLVLYVITSGLFIYNRFFFHFLGLSDITKPNFMDFTVLEHGYVYSTALILQLFTVAFASTLIFLPSSFYKNNWSFKLDNIYFKVGVIMYFIGIVPAYYIQVMTVSEFLNKGYLSVFTDGIKYEAPALIKFFGVFFRLGLFLILISIPPKKMLKLILILFLPFIFLNLMMGVRGYYFSFILVLLFYYYNFYSLKKLNLKKSFYLVFGVVLLGDLIASYRLGLMPLENGFSIFYEFFYNQGTSVLAVINSVKYQELGLIDAGYINYFDLVITPQNLLQDKVDYLVSSASKVRGLSLGGSIYQEGYLIGGFLLIFILGAFSPLVILSLSVISQRNRVLFGVFLIILPDILFSPRSRLLDFLLKNAVYLLLFLLITFLIAILFKGKK